MLRNTSVSLSEPTAALATTKATVALSVLSFEWVRLTQNLPGHDSAPFLSADEVDGGRRRHERVSRQPAPRGHVGRRARVERDDLEHLPRLEPRRCACGARAPARRSPCRRRPTPRRRGRSAPRHGVVARRRSGRCARASKRGGGRVLDDAAGAQRDDAVGVRHGELDLVQARHDGHALGGHGAERLEHGGRGLGIEARHGLVGQDDRASWASARAIATRCCWPPESWSARASARSSEPDASRQASASWRSAREKRRMTTRHVGRDARRPARTFCRAVSRRIRLNCWKISATSRRAIRSSRPRDARRYRVRG